MNRFGHFEPGRSSAAHCCPAQSRVGCVRIGCRQEQRRTDDHEIGGIGAQGAGINVLNLGRSAADVPLLRQNSLP